jgi:hypothetical protein
VAEILIHPRAYRHPHPRIFENEDDDEHEDEDDLTAFPFAMFLPAS